MEKNKEELNVISVNKNDITYFLEKEDVLLVYQKKNNREICWVCDKKTDLENSDGLFVKLYLADR